MYRRFLLASSIAAVSMFGVVHAQPAPDGPPPGENRGPDGEGREGRRGGRGDFNPEEMRARMMERIKEQMKAPDDEWAVIQPKLEKVMAAQREARMGGFGGGGFGGGGGRRGGGDNNDGPPSEIARASRELRSTLQNENASADEINAKLAALREARKKAEEELKTARESLKEVLSERQEALLVMSGMLE